MQADRPIGCLLREGARADNKTERGLSILLPRKAASCFAWYHVSAATAADSAAFGRRRSQDSG